MARDVRLNFTLSAEKHAELKQLASDLGVTMSGLVAVITGEYIQRKKLERSLIERTVDGFDFNKLVSDSDDT